MRKHFSIESESMPGDVAPAVELTPEQIEAAAVSVAATATDGEPVVVEVELTDEQRVVISATVVEPVEGSEEAAAVTEPGGESEVAPVTAEDVADISLEEESMLVAEGAATAAAIDADLNESGRVLEIADSLEDLAVVAETIEEATPAEIALVENAGALAVAGTDVSPEELVPSMESALGGRFDMTRVRAAAAAFWESIQRMVGKIWVKIEEFFHNAFGTAPALLRRTKELRTQARTILSLSHPMRAKEIVVSAGANGLSRDGAVVVNPLNLTKALTDLSTTAQYVYGTYADSAVARGEAVCAALSTFDPANTSVSATTLRKSLNRATFAAIPGARSISGPNEVFSVHAGPPVLGNISLVSKRYIGQDASDTVLGSLDRHRQSSVEVVYGTTVAESSFVMPTLSISTALSLLATCEGMLNQLETYDRGGRRRTFAATRRRLEAESKAATEQIGKKAKTAEVEAYYRSLLNFNQAFAKWSSAPTTQFTTSMIATIRSVLLVVRKSLAAHGVQKVEGPAPAAKHV